MDLPQGAHRAQEGELSVASPLARGAVARKRIRQCGRADGAPSAAWPTAGWRQLATCFPLLPGFAQRNAFAPDRQLGQSPMAGGYGKRRDPPVRSAARKPTHAPRNRRISWTPAGRTCERYPPNRNGEWRVVAQEIVLSCYRSRGLVRLSVPRRSPGAYCGTSPPSSRTRSEGYKARPMPRESAGARVERSLLD